MVVTMKLGLVVASWFVAGTAFAQAPGDMEAEVAAPGMTPVAAVPAPPPPPVRQSHWAVGLGVGSLGLTPHHSPDNETQFRLGMLALRYRPWRHLEIEVALSRGRQQTTDNQPGDLDVDQAVLALRYRFNPLKRWNLAWGR
jgi:hypothetical protein